MADDFKILEEKENPLFNRKEIKANIEADVTPSRFEARKIIAEKFSTPPENIKIKKIKGIFGARSSLINANIYSSQKEKDAVEIKRKREKEVEAKLTEKPEEPVEVKEESKKETEVVQENNNEKTEDVKEEKPVEANSEEAKEEIKSEEKKE